MAKKGKGKTQRRKTNGELTALFEAAQAARNQEAVERKENDILLRMSRVSREISTAPNPPRRRQPKVTRMVSKRQRIALSATKDTIKAIYNSPMGTSKHNVTDEPENPTREVGPRDIYNNSYNCHGKETNTR
jgi:hypothetical protein